jgi:hypothetical protein
VFLQHTALKSKTYTLAFSGQILQRGFWLYIWEATTKSGKSYLYVGRTGDSSSQNAQSPFNRMGQHLGSAPNSSMLRKHLVKSGIDPLKCHLRLVSHGPIYQEHKNETIHFARRDKTAALEKALAESMTAVGYNVLNTVRSRHEYDSKMLKVIISEFAGNFPRLKGLG